MNAITLTKRGFFYSESDLNTRIEGFFYSKSKSALMDGSSSTSNVIAENCTENDAVSLVEKLTNAHHETAKTDNVVYVKALNHPVKKVVSKGFSNMDACEISFMQHRVKSMRIKNGEIFVDGVESDLYDMEKNEMLGVHRGNGHTY